MVLCVVPFLVGFTSGLKRLDAFETVCAIMVLIVSLTIQIHCATLLRVIENTR